jgi:hypothetical protein
LYKQLLGRLVTENVQNPTFHEQSIHCIAYQLPNGVGKSEILVKMVIDTLALLRNLALSIGLANERPYIGILL